MNFVFDRTKNSFALTALILFSIISVSFGFASPATDSRDDQTHQIAESPVFRQFDEWLEIYARNNFSADDNQLKTGELLALERSEKFKQLARIAPETALSKAVAADIFRRLPVSISQYLEKPVSFDGDFLVFTVDGIDNSDRHAAAQILREISVGETRYRALVYGRRLAMTTKMNIPLSGVIFDDTMIVDENPARIIKSDEFAERASGDAETKLGSQEIGAEIGGKLVKFAGQNELSDFVRQQIEWEATINPVRPSTDLTAAAELADAPASSWTEGTKTILVIRADFSDKPGEPLDHYNQPLTTARAQTLFNTDINSFYRANSYNKTSLQAIVTPVLRLPQTEAFYAQGTNYNQMLTDARIAARAAGYETNNYNLDVVAFSYTSSIGWAGLAAVGGKSAWLNGAFYLTETAHEIGHNYGLMHANLWRTTDGTPFGAGSNVEYGDCFDTMGACSGGNSNRHFNARYKRLLDWITESEVQTVAASGNYRIYAQDSANAGIRALKINRDSTKTYWIEFRQLTPGNAQNGALVRWDYSNQGFRETQLLDMTPSTASTADAPLAVGQSFYDSAANIRITVLGKGGTSPESLDVRIEMGNQPVSCSYSLSAAGATVASNGGSASVNVVAPAGCGWTAASNQSFVSITSGANGTGNGTVSYFVGQNASAGSRAATLTIAGQAFNVTQFGAIVSGGRSVLYDFDGDGRADISVFRPSDGTWYLSRSSAGFAGINFGLATDKTVAADYDGDGKTDPAVYRGGAWYLQRSSLGFAGINFGLATDIPAPADYDGDGRAELAVFRPANGTWYFYNLANNNFSAVQFGMAGDKPVAADYDGDGKTDIAVYRPSDGTWYLLRSQLGFTAARFGTATDMPVPADYDGDGRAEAAVFRAGMWHLLQTGQGSKSAGFGLATDLPVPASRQ